MIRLVLARNDLLTSFDPRAQIFRVDVEFSTCYHAQNKISKKWSKVTFWLENSSNFDSWLGWVFQKTAFVIPGIHEILHVLNHRLWMSFPEIGLAMREDFKIVPTCLTSRGNRVLTVYNSDVKAHWDTVVRKALTMGFVPTRWKMHSATNKQTIGSV